MTRCLNLGCGRRFHPAWTNVDGPGSGAGVLEHDLRRPLPFADGTFDLVYHSHVLEHFARDDAAGFLAECRRVLDDRGVLRVVVPDLEALARGYLASLERASAATPVADAEHDWMVIELIDQCVRHEPGGAMAKRMRAVVEGVDPAATFIRQRTGGELSTFERAMREAPAPSPPRRPRSRQSLRNAVRRGRQALIDTALGAEQEALRVGRFRLRGEVHQWMYDRHSLAALLRKAGFAQIQLRDAATSSIAGWPAFGLDTEPDGQPYKPDSLYMEASKA